MLFREGERRPWVVAGSMGGDIQPQIHVQLVSALVDGGADVATAVGGAAGRRRAGRLASRRRSPCSPTASSRRASRRACSGAGPRPRPRRLRRRAWGTSTRSSCRRRPGGGRHAGGHDRPAELRAPGRPLTRGPRDRALRRSGAIADGILRRAGGRLRSHRSAAGIDARGRGGDLERRPELSRTPARPSRTARSTSRRWSRSARDLAGKLDAETTPLDTNERWWVWKCPTTGLPGPPARRGLRPREARRLRRLRRDLREDLPALAPSPRRGWRSVST